MWYCKRHQGRATTLYCEDTRVSVEPLCGTVKILGCEYSHYVVLSRHEGVSRATTLYCKDTRVSVEPLRSTVKTRGCQ